MSNPFEDENDSYLALINDEGQYSLWPDWIAVPAGWRRAFGPDGRQACLQYIEENWADMRPKSLVAAMEQQAE